MPTPTISVQLYTVREAATEDLRGTLQRLADIGFTRVEPFAFTTFAELGEALRATGLAAPTTHQSFLGSSASELDSLFARAAALGMGTVIDPYVPPERWTSADGVRETADALNAAATVAARHGVTVGYHNHAHEVEHRIGETTALEHLATLLDDGVVLEVDSYWVAVGGVDPVTLLERLGERVTAVHIKDGPPSPEPLDQVAVGSGALPIAEIVAASPRALHVIELDDCRGDRFAAVEESYAFLSRLGGAA